MSSTTSKPSPGKPSTGTTSAGGSSPGKPAELHVTGTPVSFEEFRAKLGAKDAANAAKRLNMEPPEKAKLWQRLCATLMSLSGHSAKVNSQPSVQFFVADGKYKMQTFALQDDLPGELTIFCKDVLQPALDKKLLQKPKAGDAPHTYKLPGSAGTLHIEALTIDGPEHPPAYKDLMSWGRKCMRVSVPINASDELIAGLEKILAISATPGK